MEAARTPSLSSPLGRISISHEAVAHIVGRLAAEAYGVVGMAPRNPRERLLDPRTAATGDQRRRQRRGRRDAEVEVRIQDVKRSTA